MCGEQGPGCSRLGRPGISDTGAKTPALSVCSSRQCAGLRPLPHLAKAEGARPCEEAVRLVTPMRLHFANRRCDSRCSCNANFRSAASCVLNKGRVAWAPSGGPWGQAVQDGCLCTPLLDQFLLHLCPAHLTDLPVCLSIKGAVRGVPLCWSPW